MIYDKNNRYNDLFHNNQYEIKLKNLKMFFNKLDDIHKNFIYFIYFKFKEINNSSYYHYLIIVYSLLYFKKIKITNSNLTKKVKKDLILLLSNCSYEREWDVKNILKTYLEMWKELTFIKMLIKYGIITNPDYKKFIDHNRKDYCKNLWYIIPLLSYYWLYWSYNKVFQDTYFKTVNEVEYNKVKDQIDDFFEKINTRKDIFESITNNFSMQLNNKKILNIFYIRKKSYFSIYNKFIKNKDIKDLLWIKILVSNMKDLYKIDELFTKKYNIINKKDYYNKSKANWYNWIHYILKYLHFWKTIPIEIQVRTWKDENEIKNNINKNHFTYSINNNKWGVNFKEINKSLEVLWNLIIKK